MNRKPEKISAMTGAVIAVLLMSITMVLVFQITANSTAYDDIGIHFNKNDIATMYFLYIPAWIASITALVAALRVEKNTKVCGIILIVCACVLIFANILNIVSFALLMVSGVMCLIRKPKTLVTHQ